MSNRKIPAHVKAAPIVPKWVQLIIVDLFCGAGGFTEGAEQAVDEMGRRLAVVIAAVNHDKGAIASHKANHPETVHFIEDVRYRSLPERILAVVEQARILYPNAKLLLHASLECTNFSNAKGGRSRDADSRSLAVFMPSYLDILKPDLFTVENVREFLGWGPLIPRQKKTKEGYSFCPIEYVTVAEWRKQWMNLNATGEIQDHEFINLFKAYIAPYEVPYALSIDQKSDDQVQIVPILKPEDRTKNKFFLFWKQYIVDRMNYQYEHQLANTANFGANTSRTRLFAQFVRNDLPLVWPLPTHAKNPQKDMYGASLERWRPIRECLELEDKGKSIFRDKPLSEKTYERIFEGLVRHVGNGDRSFISKYFTGTGMHFGLDQPAATVKTRDNQALITAEPFMARLFATASNNHGTYPSDQPATTITTADGHAIVSPEPFAMTYYSGSPENRVKSMNDPAQTITTCNRIGLVTPEPFVMQSNGGVASSKVYPSDEPSRVITTSDNQSAVFCMKYHSTGHNTFPADQPCSTLPTNDSVGVVQTDQFIHLCYTQGKREQSIDDASAALTTVPKHQLVSAVFVDQQYGQSKPASLDEPGHTVTCNPHSALIQAAFVVDPQWGGKSHSLDNPGHTIIARQDKAPSSLVTADFITQRNGHEARNYPLDEPARTITTTGGNMELVQPEWLLTNMHKNPGTSLNAPAPTLLTGTHHYMMSTAKGESDQPHWGYLIDEQGTYSPAILFYETDTYWQQRIKAFMAEFGIADILMRMLKVLELKLIQGFPANYVLIGNQTDQKKYIGNSVPPVYPKAWVTRIALALREFFFRAA